MNDDLFNKLQRFHTKIKIKIFLCIIQSMESFYSWSIIDCKVFFDVARTHSRLELKFLLWKRGRQNGSKRCSIYRNTPSAFTYVYFEYLLIIDWHINCSSQAQVSMKFHPLNRIISNTSYIQRIRTRQKYKFSEVRTQSKAHKNQTHTWNITRWWI